MARDIVIDISPKEKYEPLYASPKMYNDLWGGRGRGGSHEATLYALFRLTSPDYCRIAFVRKILGDVRHSLWRDFKDRISECGIPDDDFAMSDHEMRAIYKPTGNIITSFGVKAEGGRTAKLKSLAGYNLVIIEECEEMTEEEFDQLDDSLRTIKGQPPMIIRVFNPPGRLHWIWKRDYTLTEKEVYVSGEKQSYWRATSRTDRPVLSIFGTHLDNILNLDAAKVAKWQAYKESNPEYYYTVIAGLISEGQRGRIYSGWQPITQEQFKAIDARSIWGLDFGENDPAGLVEVKLVKNKAYGREHIYKPLTVKEIAIELCKLGLTGSDMIVADSADPININKLLTGWTRDELTDKENELYPRLRQGFYVVGAIKGPGSILSGIKSMKELQWHICEDSENLWNEYREYKWALDKDKNPTNQPEDKYNHLQDPSRYIVTARGRLF